MKGTAIYLGYRNVDLKERQDTNGNILPALKGKNYTFFSNEWEPGGKMTENGGFFNQTVKTGEEEPNLIVGEIYTIKIKDLNNKRCEVELT